VTDKVVDASALAAIVFAEPATAVVEQLITGHRLFAPYLLKSEMANICAKKIRAIPAQRDVILALFSAAWGMPIGLQDIDPIGVVSMSERLKLSAYDASYLWLAHSLGAELVTLDERLRKAAMAP
jgi:predicted nucleic acid-binding protein